jgi:hypothetical protein
MRNTTLNIFGALLIAVWAVQSLALAGPAMAASDDGYRTHRVYHKHCGRVILRMPAEAPDDVDSDLAHYGNGDWDTSGVCARNPIRALCLNAN